MLKELDEYISKQAVSTKNLWKDQKRHLMRFWEFTRKDVRDIEHGDIQDFKLFLKRQFKEQHVRNHLRDIKSFFSFLNSRGVVCLNGSEIKLPRARSTPHMYLAYPEYVRMMAHCRTDTFRELQKTLIIRLLYETGVRVSELCDMDIQDINTWESWATIETKKTRQMKTIVWSETTHQLLLRHLGIRICLNQAPALFVGINRDDTPSKRITPRTVQRICQEKAQIAHLVRKVTPHCLRHGRAKRIRDLGGDLSIVKEVLGHIHPQSTFFYLQWGSKDYIKRAKELH